MDADVELRPDLFSDTDQALRSQVFLYKIKLKWIPLSISKEDILIHISFF